MDSGGWSAPPNELSPQYDLDNTLRVQLPCPAAPDPDSSIIELRPFLRDYFAYTCQLPPDHQFVLDLAARFQYDGHSLYSAFESELMLRFGDGTGRELHRFLRRSKLVGTLTSAATFISCVLSLRPSVSVLPSLGLGRDTQLSYRSPQASDSTSSDSPCPSSTTPPTPADSPNISYIATGASTIGQSSDGGISLRRPHSQTTLE